MQKFQTHLSQDGKPMIFWNSGQQEESNKKKVTDVQVNKNASPFWSMCIAVYVKMFVAMSVS